MLTLATISHHTAPIAIRERLGIATDDLNSVLERAQLKLGPTAIISTCNRFELYVSGTHEAEQVLDFIEMLTAGNRQEINRHFHILHDREVINHLYRVSAGLESMILGESEILGQLRGAFSAATDAGLDDMTMVRLFHGAIRAGRRARHETAIGHHALSVSSIAVQQARALHPNLEDAHVLVIGAGEAARLTAEALVTQGVHKVTVANRTVSRAEALASELRGNAVSFDELPDALSRCEVVVAASGAPNAIVEYDLVADVIRRREGVPLLFIDIGMPRDIDPAVNDLPGVNYHDMEGLQEIAAENGQAREREIGAVETVLEEEAAIFLNWWDQLASQPTIALLNRRAERMRQTAIEKSLRKLDIDDTARQEIDALTRTIVKRMLHDPISLLRQRGDQERQYIEAARTLFNLDDEVSTKTSDTDPTVS